MTKHSYFSCANTCSATPHNSIIKHTIHHIPHVIHKHTPCFNTPRLNKHYFQQRPLHNKHAHSPPHIHYNRHKTNMRHIHTSIVSRHLATKGNNKILRTPPPHTSSSEEILPLLTRRTLAQLRTNKSTFLKSYLHKVDAKTHPSPLCPSVTSITTMPPL